jgi:lipoprotein-anchoring transpeptidase ErfK/SrfK
MHSTIFKRAAATVISTLILTAISTTVRAAALFPFPFLQPPQFEQSPGAAQVQPQFEYDGTPVSARFKRQVVSYETQEAPGTIIIDTPNTYLYLVLGNGQAIRYGIGIGRDGFTWSGVQSITRKAEWPSWTPPAQMIRRQPYLPRHMPGGIDNPLGARAIYLGNTMYRIHGTNAPETIGTHVSSGCLRLTNEDITDLYSRVGVGSKVIVLPTERRTERSFARQS